MKLRNFISNQVGTVQGIYGDDFKTYGKYAPKGWVKVIWDKSRIEANYNEGELLIYSE